ncbi:MAG: hypothetical protein CMO01_26620 [Thalassobius sp.]|nr:hypothetical protein [Thalassovita sp.]
MLHTHCYQYLIILLVGFFFHTNYTYAQDLPRVIVSTDIGGDDPDDFQSMVHFLLYADRFDIEGLISSPPKEGRAKHIKEAIAAYALDYPKLKQHGDFPKPSKLLKLTKQGATDAQAGLVPQELSDGAEWIIKKAQSKDERPLYILVWGSITDVAQAVYKAPNIKEKIRVYSIGSWNTRLDSLSRNYLYEQHPDLWWIENNSTFRGMYMGGNQADDYGNLSFIEKHVKDYGAMGKLFWDKKKDIKMGDTPAVLYMLNGNPAKPESESWGGAFIKTDHSSNYWTDNPDASLIVNDKAGAKTVNKWRKAYLDDWKERMLWLR